MHIDIVALIESLQRVRDDLLKLKIQILLHDSILHANNITPSQTMWLLYYLV